MSITAYRDYVSDLEPKLHDLIHATSIADNLVEALISHKPVGTGSPTLYRITDDDANMAIYALGEAISKARDLQKEWSAFVKTVNDPLGGRAADVVVTDQHSAVRVAWRHAMSEFAYGIQFPEMSLVYDLLQAVGDIALDAAEQRREGDARTLLQAIHEDIASIRAAIGRYCIDVATKDHGEGVQSDPLCDGIALKELSFDVEGNAEEIAAIGARVLAAATSKAPPVTARAA
jgi:hypothetical protein